SGWFPLTADGGVQGLRLAAGDVSIRLPPAVARSIDQLFFTSAPDQHPLTPITAGRFRRFLWMEAETAALAPPMQADRHDEASGGRFVQVPEGPGNDPP